MDWKWVLYHQTEQNRDSSRPAGSARSVRRTSTARLDGERGPVQPPASTPVALELRPLVDERATRVSREGTRRPPGTLRVLVCERDASRLVSAAYVSTTFDTRPTGALSPSYCHLESIHVVGRAEMTPTASSRERSQPPVDRSVLTESSPCPTPDVRPVTRRTPAAGRAV